jgi:hypothetical protein
MTGPCIHLARAARRSLQQGVTKGRCNFGSCIVAATINHDYGVPLRAKHLQGRKIPGDTRCLIANRNHNSQLHAQAFSEMAPPQLLP